MMDGKHIYFASSLGQSNVSDIIIQLGVNDRKRRKDQGYASTAKHHHPRGAMKHSRAGGWTPKKERNRKGKR